MRIVIAALLATLPTLAQAQSTCADKHQASSCQAGYVWDNEAKNCVQQINS